MVCFKSALIPLFLLVCLDAQAAFSLTPQDQKLIEQGKALTDAASLPAEGRIALEHAATHQQAAHDTAEKSRQQIKQWQQNPLATANASPPTQHAMVKPPRLLIFASQSLGPKGLDELLQLSATMPQATVVFRGISKDMPLGQGMLAIQALAANKQPTPHIVIDPTLFDRYHVTAVPTVVLLNNSATAVSARVSGLADPAWLMQQFERGNHGDQGIRGPVSTISEPDLIEVMKARFAAIDWEAKKQAVKERFWKMQSFHLLPLATRSQTRFIDPSVALTRDITGGDGAMIAKQGTVMNPLDMRPFTQAVVVFDPLDKKQLEWLNKTIPTLKKRPGVTRLTLIATQFEREKGWDAYTKLTDTVAAPVYLLTPDLVERFVLTVTPSIITAQGKRFVIEEVAPPAPSIQEGAR